MKEIEKWNSQRYVADFLADRLLHGHILPCLGAGVSRFAKLPDWKTLLANLNSTGAGDGHEGYLLAESILQEQFNGNKQEFYKEVHKKLFGRSTVSNLMGVIQADSGLRALSMLCFRSVRGGSRFVVTFNYDDLLELYLRDLGLACKSVGNHRFVIGNADVCVLHPHGVLPLKDKNKNMDRSILIAQSDFGHVRESSWSSSLNMLFSKHFPVFIGLGGADLLLYDYIDEAAKASYFFEDEGWPYNGIRFCSSDDTSISIFEGKKIKCVTFDDIASEWPEFVSSVCRRAAKKAEKLW